MQTYKAESPNPTRLTGYRNLLPSSI